MTDAPLRTPQYPSVRRVPQAPQRVTASLRKQKQGMSFLGILLVILVLGGVIGTVAAWQFGMLPAINRTHTQSAKVAEPFSNPDTLVQPTVLPQDRSEIELEATQSAAPQLQGPNENIQNREVIIDEAAPLTGSFANESHLEARGAFAVLKDVSSLAVPKFRSVAKAPSQYAPCYLQRDRACPAFPLSVDNSNTGITIELQGTKQLSWELMRENQGADYYFQYMYGWVPMYLSSMKSYYESSLKYELEQPYGTSLQHIYQSAVQGQMDPVTLALWTEQVFKTAETYGFALNTRDQQVPINYELFVEDWHSSSDRFSKPTRFWSRFVEPTLITKLRPVELHPEEKGLIYASYRQLHPGLVERMFTDWGWLEQNYAQLVSQVYSKNGTVSLQVEERDIFPQPYFTNFEQKQEYQPWIGCNGYSSVSCVPSFERQQISTYLLGENGELPTPFNFETQTASGSAPTTSSSMVQESPVAAFAEQAAQAGEYPTSWSCHAIAQFSALCSEPTLLAW